ncbi:hypothetical protein F4774DRAFT_409157 [Daldinia eschscholtzii]|nr:hypothetical protein F4774DRAFT_409157 [Daldinia eschscholtzii]
MSARTSRVSGVSAGSAASSATAAKSAASALTSAVKGKARALARARQPSTGDEPATEEDNSGGSSDEDPFESETDSSDESTGSSPGGSSSSEADDDDDDGWTSGDTCDDFDVDFEGNGTVFAYPQGHRPPKQLPPRTLTTKEDMLLTHYNKLSETMKGVAMVFVRQLGSMDKRNSIHVLEQRPPLTMVDCRSSIPEVKYDKYWTPGDEVGLRDMWEVEPIKKKLDDLDVKKNKDILPLWKVIRRFLGCFPTDIINRRNYLQFSKADVDEEDQDAEDTNWPKSFCRKFKQLALHHVFGLNPNLLTLALLYVVICRTDYRGRIPWCNPTTDCFLDTFLLRVQDQDGSKSVVRIHQEVFSDYLRRGKYPGSIMSELMRRIERRAFRKKDGAPFRPAKVPVFKLTTADVSIVTRAANAVRPGGILQLPLSVTSRMVIAAQKTHDAPKTLDELNRLRKKLILRDWRDEIIEGRRAAEASAIPSAAVEAPDEKGRIGEEVETEEEEEEEGEAEEVEVEAEMEEDDGFAPVFTDFDEHSLPFVTVPAVATSATSSTSTPALASGVNERKRSGTIVSDGPSKRPRMDTPATSGPADIAMDLVRSVSVPTSSSTAVASTTSPSKRSGVAGPLRSAPTMQMVGIEEFTNRATMTSTIGRRKEPPSWSKLLPGRFYSRVHLFGPRRNEYMVSTSRSTRVADFTMRTRRSFLEGPPPLPREPDKDP